MTTTETLAAALDAVKVTRDSAGATAATRQAADYLAAGTITTSDYMHLARWSEGRDTRTTAEWLAT